MNQSYRQASIRAVTGTAWTYEGDWHALFDQAGIASGDYNGRLLAWINQSMGASYSELNGAMQAFAVSQSVPSWNEMGTFTPGSAPVASWDASTSTLVQLAALVSHSRTSLATMFDSTGKLTYAPNNLLLNTATLGTQTVTVQVGVNYLLSIKGTGSVTLTGASTAGPLNGTGASNRVDLKITAATSSLTLTVSGSVTSARLSAVTYEAAFRSQDDVDNTASAYYGPRIDYDPNTLAVKGLLIEEARTKSLVQSNTLSNASWSRNLVGAPVQNVTGIDGTTSAWTVTASSTADTFLYQTGSFVGPYAYSAVFKAGTNNWAYIAANGGGNKRAYVFFDLTNGVVGSTSFRPDGAYAGTLTGSGIIPLGNGFYRCWMAVTGTTDTYVAFGLSDANTSVVTTNGRTFIASDLEAEAGAFPTSITRTAAASVTRAADVVQFIGPALTAIQGASFSAIVEAQTSRVPTTSRMLLGANAAVAFMYAPSVDNQTTFYDGTSGVATAGAGGGKLWSTIARSGISISGSSASLVMTGGGVATGTHALPARTTAYLGSYSLGEYVNGWVRSFAIYTTRLPDATLQARSVVGASF